MFIVFGVVLYVFNILFCVVLNGKFLMNATYGGFVGKVVGFRFRGVVCFCEFFLW